MNLNESIVSFFSLFTDQLSYNVKLIQLKNHLTTSKLPSNQGDVIWQSIFK